MINNYLILFPLIGLFFIQSCSKDALVAPSDQFIKDEQKWITCYNERWNFPNEEEVQSLEYIKFILNDSLVLINNGKTDFDGRLLYSTSGQSPVSSVHFDSLYSNITHRLIISFVKWEYLQYVGLILKYPTDSLNYTLQKVFSEDQIKCSSNFIENSPEFMVTSYCKNNGSINFSTLNSTIENQFIKIDSFSYQLNQGILKYHLAYSTDNIQVTNSVWNERKKIDYFGNLRHSDVYVENLTVKDLSCVIEFELPED